MTVRDDRRSARPVRTERGRIEWPTTSYTTAAPDGRGQVPRPVVGGLRVGGSREEVGRPCRRPLRSHRVGGRARWRRRCRRWGDWSGCRRGWCRRCASGRVRGVATSQRQDRQHGHRTHGDDGDRDARDRLDTRRGPSPDGTPERPVAGNGGVPQPGCGGSTRAARSARHTHGRLRSRSGTSTCRRAERPGRAGAGRRIGSGWSRDAWPHRRSRPVRWSAGTPIPRPAGRHRPS